MERKYHTYRYINILNGMKYNGCTCKEQSRRAGKDGYQYVKNCPMFGEAILEFGWPNFKYELLEDGLTKEEAYQKEKEHIKEDNSIWPNGYNLEGGGKKGKSVHSTTREKLSEKAKDEVPPMFGKHHSEESKRKISEKHTGVPNPLKWKPVIQLTKDGQFYAEYSSVKEASERTKINANNISSCCCKKPHYLTAGGYKWEFKSL